MLNFENAKKILELEDETEINANNVNKAYKRLALKYHPDKYRDNPEEAKNMMQDINSAKEFFKAMFDKSHQTTLPSETSSENKPQTPPTETPSEQKNHSSFYKNKWDNQCNHLQADIDQLKKT